MDRLLGDHRLLRPIGRGGMGEVWEAEHLPTGARRAIKLLPRHADADLRLRFVREAEAQARVGDHPHVGKVHAAGSTPEGQGWLAMDLLPGGSLAERLPLAPRESAAIAAKLARALAHVHALGVLHRDVKPANVLFDGRGEPVLVDFGLARLTDGQRLTSSNAVLGTPTHTAPEQLEAAHAAGPQADVYGLGALLYQLLTGVAPFSGASLAQLAHAVLFTAPRAPRELVPSTPPGLEAIVLRCLAKDPARRPAGAGALATELEGWLAGGPELARDPRVRALAAAVVLLSLALGAAVLLGRDPPATPDPTPPAEPSSRSPQVRPPPSRLADPPPTIDVALLAPKSSLSLTRQRMEEMALSEPPLGEGLESVGGLAFDRDLLRRVQAGDPAARLEMADQLSREPGPSVMRDSKMAGWLYRELALGPAPLPGVVSRWGFHLAARQNHADLAGEGLALLEAAADHPQAGWEEQRRLVEALIERGIAFQSLHPRIERARARLLRLAALPGTDPAVDGWLGLALFLPASAAEESPAGRGEHLREAIARLEAHRRRRGAETELRFLAALGRAWLDPRAGSLDPDAAQPLLLQLLERRHEETLTWLSTVAARRDPLPRSLTEALAPELARWLDDAARPQARLRALAGLTLVAWQAGSAAERAEWLARAEALDAGIVDRWRKNGFIPR